MSVLRVAGCINILTSSHRVDTKASRAIWLINHERWLYILPVSIESLKYFFFFFILSWLTWSWLNTTIRQYNLQCSSIFNSFLFVLLHLKYQSTPFGSSFQYFSASLHSDSIWYVYGIFLLYFHFISFDFNRILQNHCGLL